MCSKESKRAHILQCEGVHPVFLVSRVFSPAGQWPAMLASCGATGLSRTQKNVLAWQGAKKLIVWVWLPSVSLAVLLHLYKNLRAPLRDERNSSSREKRRDGGINGPGSLLDFTVGTASSPFMEQCCSQHRGKKKHVSGGSIRAPHPTDEELPRRGRDPMIPRS